MGWTVLILMVIYLFFICINRHNFKKICGISVLDVTPSAVHVGNIVQGVRLAWAQGRDIGSQDDDSDAAKKVPLHFNDSNYYIASFF